MKGTLKILFFSFFLISAYLSFSQQSIFNDLNNLINEKKYNEALYKLDKINKTAKDNNDTLTQIRIYDLYFKIFKVTFPSNYKKFLTSKINIEKKYLKNHFDTVLLDDLFYTYLNLVEFYENSGDYYFALNICQIILKDNDFEKFKPQIEFKLAELYVKINDFGRAYKYLNSTIDYATFQDDSDLLIDALYNRAKLYFDYSLYVESINDLLWAFNMAQTKNDIFKQSKVANSLADVLYTLEFYSKAAEFYKFVVSAKIDATSNNENLSDVYLKLGKAYYKSKLYDSAISVLQRSLILAQNDYNFAKISQIYSYIGQCYFDKDELKTAESYLTQAVLVCNKIKDTAVNVEVYIAFGKLNYIKNDYTKAIFYFSKAFDEVKGTSKYAYSKELSFYLSKIYKQQYNLPKALYYSEYYGMSSDSIDEIRKRLTINKIEAESILKNKSFIYENQVQNLQKGNKDLVKWIIFMALSLASFVLVLIFYFSKNKQLKNTQKALELQNKKLKIQYERNKMLSLVSRNTTNSIFILDKNWRVIWVNNVLLELYNTTRNRIFNEIQGDFKLLTTSKFEELKNICETNKNSHVYKTNYNFNGKIKWIQTSISPFIENDEIKYYIGIENDITDFINAQKEIEKQKQNLEHNAKLLEVYNKELKDQKEEIVAQNEELRQQQEELILNNELLAKYNLELKRFSVAASETDNIIYFFDLNGDIIWVNESFTKYIGYTLDELIEQRGSNIHDLSSIPDIDFYFYLCIEHKKPVKYVSEITTKHGKKLWQQTTLTPIKDDFGTVYEIVGIDSDITDVKKAEIKIIEQNKEIRQSLEYAQRIQKSVLPMKIYLDAILDKYFIFYRPRDIVSGDFYYVNYQNGKNFITVADCTGHGIPGALMSILGSMAIKNALATVGFENLNNFVDFLNNFVMQILHQYGKKTDTFDSIDLAACVIEQKNFSIEYVGANIPLYIYKTNNQKLYRIKPTKATIGYNYNDAQFVVHSFKYDKGDRIFLASDGFTDQFGGRDNKRLKRDGFIELLEQLNIDEFENFEQNLDNFLNQWMGDNEQIDDILVFGTEL